MCAHSTAYILLRHPVSFITHHVPKPPRFLIIFSTNHLVMLITRGRHPLQFYSHSDTARYIVRWRPIPFSSYFYPTLVCSLTSNNGKQTTDKSEATEYHVEHLPEAPDPDEKYADISSNNDGCNGTHISANIPLLGCLFGCQR